MLNYFLISKRVETKLRFQSLFFDMVPWCNERLSVFWETGDRVFELCAPSRHLQGPSRLLTAVDISPDDRYIAGGGASGELFGWRLSTRHIAWTHEIPGQSVTSMEFSRDGELLVIGSTSDPLIVHPGAEKARLELFKRHFAASPNETYADFGIRNVELFVARHQNEFDIIREEMRPRKGSVLILNAEDGSEVTTLAIDWKSVIAVGCNSDSTLVAAGGKRSDGKSAVGIWNVNDNSLLQEFTFDSQVKCLQFSPNEDRRIAIGLNKGTIEVIDIPAF